MEFVISEQMELTVPVKFVFAKVAERISPADTEITHASALKAVAPVIASTWPYTFPVAMSDPREFPLM